MWTSAPQIPPAWSACSDDANAPERNRRVQALPFILFLESPARLLPFLMQIHCPCFQGGIQIFFYLKVATMGRLPLLHTRDRSLICCVVTSGLMLPREPGARKALQSVDVLLRIPCVSPKKWTRSAVKLWVLQMAKGESGRHKGDTRLVIGCWTHS